MRKSLSAFLIVFAVCVTSCTTARSPDTSATDTLSSQNETDPSEEKDRPAPREDEEDAFIYRVLAAPAYVWEGLTYPVKKMSIFYEEVDLLERALDFFLNEERTGGIYPSFSLGGVISTGIGFTAFHNNLFNKKKEGRISYLFAVRGNQIADATYTDPAFFGSRFKLDTEIDWINADEGRFFPNGNDARERDERLFALNQVSLAARLSRLVARFGTASFLARFYTARGKQSDRGGVQIDQTTPGVGPRVEAFEVEPGVRYDSRDNRFVPSTGSLLDAVFTYTDQVDGDEFRYLGYTLEAQHYISIFRDRVLVFRGLLAKQNALGDRAIPFYELNVLDLNHGLRGFQRGRWRDEGRLLFTVEWRYPVWERFQGSIFFDTGQVFNEFKDLEVKTFRYSAGVGFRFVTTRSFAFRAHVAASEDGVLALLRGDLEFLRKRGTFLGAL